MSASTLSRLWSSRSATPKPLLADVVSQPSDSAEYLPELVRTGAPISLQVKTLASNDHFSIFATDRLPGLFNTIRHRRPVTLGGRSVGKEQAGVSGLGLEVQGLTHRHGDVAGKCGDELLAGAKLQCRDRLVSKAFNQ